MDGFKILHAYRMAQDRGKVKGLWTVRQLSQSIIGVAVDISFQVKFFLFNDIEDIAWVSVNFIEHFVDESVKIHWKFLNCVNNNTKPSPRGPIVDSLQSGTIVSHGIGFGVIL